MTSRILITGTTSIHGFPVYEYFKRKRSFSVRGIRSPKMNVPSDPIVTPLCITDRKGLLKIKQQFNPAYVIHCAGVCDLDVCEERPQWAEQLNVHGAKAILDIFGESSHIMYLSSDLVYSPGAPSR